MLRVWLPLFFAALLPFSLFAGQDDSPKESRVFCPREFKKLLKRTRKHLPDSLPLTPREQEHAGEIHNYGTVLKEDQPIPERQKKDGHYVYLIAYVRGEEFVVWSLRAPGAWSKDPSKNLVTHSSLFRQLQRTTGAEEEEIKVYAAGQVQFLNGVTSRLDNKSGTRRGQFEHLAYAENVLEGRGVEFGSIRKRPITMRDDYSKAGPDIELHKEADAMARIHVRVQADEDLRALRDRLTRLHRKLYDQFPELRHKTTLGYLDYEALFTPPFLIPETDLPYEDYWEIQSAKIALKYVQVDGADLAALNARHLPTETLDLLDRGLAIMKRRQSK